MKSKSKKTLVILDSNAIIHRSFHALPDLRTSRGELVNAVYGFISVLLKVFREFDPEYIAASFDVAGPTFREEEFAEYKATRQKAPDELYAQIPIIKEVLKCFNVSIYEKEGFEADDVIGTISEEVSKSKAYSDVETVIVSGDLDTLQLINKKTKVYTMRKGLQDTVIYNEDGVKNRFNGLAPKQMADFKGLRGDPSDNIPGVPGVGEKTAIQLLLVFGSLDSLYKNIEKNTALAKELKPKLHEKLEQHKEQAFFSRELATIRKDVPIKFQLEDLKWKDFDESCVRDIFDRLEFRGFLNRLQEIRGKAENTPKGQEETLKDSKKEPVPLSKYDHIFSRINMLYKEGVYSSDIKLLEEKLVPVLMAMEEAGIKIDKSYFRKLGGEVKHVIEKTASDIYTLSGKSFNINSPSQLSKVLFEDLNIGRKGIKKTPGGVISTAASELEKLQGTHPVIEHLLKYRELTKLQSTYIESLPELANKNDRIHSHFDQFGAATGRISSSNPNLQNIPVRSEWGRKIRFGFIAEKGFKFLAFDYSQIELRIAAHISNDYKMIEFFREGKDIHKMTAAEVFGVPMEKVSPEMRYKAKALNFGVLYGMGAVGFAKSAGIGHDEARQFIDGYFARFPAILDYIENTKKFAASKGYTETLLGRRRYVPEIASSNPKLRAQAERMAINHPIQGTGADIIKLAMVNARENLRFAGKNECRILLQIHDELLFECSAGIMEEAAGHIKDIMENAFKLKTPLVVDVKKGDNWGKLE